MFKNNKRPNNFPINLYNLSVLIRVYRLTPWRVKKIYQVRSSNQESLKCKKDVFSKMVKPQGEADDSHDTFQY